MDKESCKGCRRSYMFDEQYNCVLFIESIDCPCSTCLIKSMCITLCDEVKNISIEWIANYVKE